VPAEDGDVRYRLLETMRAYARERLAESNESTELALRHARYLLTCARESEERWRAGEFDDPFRRLAAELDELRVAFDWSIGERQDIEHGAALAGTTWRIWFGRGLEAEGLLRVEAARAALAPSSALELQAPLELASAHLRLDLSLPGALEAADRAVDLHRRSGDEFGGACSLFARGMALRGAQRHSEAIRCHEEALARFRSLGFQEMVGLSLLNLGITRIHLAENEAAREFLEQARAVFRLTGDERGCALVMHNLGVVERESGAFEAALESYREALAIYRRRDDQSAIAQVLFNSGLASLDLKRFSDAREATCESLVSARTLGLRGQVFYALALLARIAAAQRDPTRAARVLGYISAALEDFADPTLVENVDVLKSELAAMVAPDELARLLAEGAALNEEAAVAEALETKG
jgi:tetratricopeptide (TPR) repeat protein